MGALCSKLGSWCSSWGLSSSATSMSQNNDVGRNRSDGRQKSTGEDIERQALLAEEDHGRSALGYGYGSMMGCENRSGKFPKRFFKILSNNSTSSSGFSGYENRNHNFLNISHSRPGSIINKKGKGPRRTKEVRFVLSEKDEELNRSDKSEQQRLNSIVEETTKNMIDVSGAGDTYLSRHEVQERSRRYAKKLGRLSPSLLKPLRSLHMQTRHRSGSDKKIIIDCSGNISQEDICLMKWATENIAEALQSIRVQEEHEFVVPFPSWTTDNIVAHRSDSF